MNIYYQGFKMFSLSVPEEERIKNEMPNLPLRKSGLWYPEIPSARETIHEYIYLSLEPPTSEFRPFIYLNFGGDRGSHLKHLTKISVATQGTYLSSIRFHYGTEVEPVNLERLYLPPDSNNSNISYDIDGPGGERIIGICVKDAISMQNEKLFGITGLQVRRINPKFIPTSYPILTLKDTYNSLVLTETKTFRYSQIRTGQSHSTRT